MNDIGFTELQVFIIISQKKNTKASKLKKKRKCAKLLKCTFGYVEPPANRHVRVMLFHDSLY